MYELKQLSKKGVPAALEKAERYRLLNEPREAESICQDVLDVDAGNQEALRILILALTDQFPHRLARCFDRAREQVGRLESEYERTYYGAIVCERRAKAALRASGPRWQDVVHDWLSQAMRGFEQAIELAPRGNDDAILRWNTCARILNENPIIQARNEEPFQPLLE